MKQSLCGTTHNLHTLSFAP